MIMTPPVRKFALTVHVTSSIGWLGAVTTFLVLTILGLAGKDEPMARAAYVAMGPITWYAIVPLALASLLTGLISSLGTVWGLFRHYWVLLKFLLITFATVVLLMQLGPISHVAGAAAETTLSATVLRETRISLVVHAGGGLLVLLTATVLAVYKPKGRTRYGRCK
ncbi:membrane protein [Planomonospora sphaerica]|uniref:Membrane protein n=2 Tax=Planomonospora sphaerica TaxID=161355 RepID=A0A171DPK6_9ACTN|nr:membrane protein [Planomonospora sphaerica]